MYAEVHKFENHLSKFYMWCNMFEIKLYQIIDIFEKCCLFLEYEPCNHNMNYSMSLKREAVLSLPSQYGMVAFNWR